MTRVNESRVKEGAHGARDVAELFGEGDDFVLELARATLFVGEFALEGVAFRSELRVGVGDELGVGSKTVERTSKFDVFVSVRLDGGPGAKGKRRGGFGV